MVSEGTDNSNWADLKKLGWRVLVTRGLNEWQLCYGKRFGKGRVVGKGTRPDLILEE